MMGFAWEAKVKALAEWRESPEQREARLEAVHQAMEETRRVYRERRINGGADE